MKPFFSVYEKTATPLHQSMPVCINQIMAGKPSSAIVCCYTQGFSFGNTEFSKYQLIIDHGRDFVEAVYFLAKKKTASPFAFQQPPRAGVFSRSPTPYPPPPLFDYKSNVAGRRNDRELTTLARTNKTPALQAMTVITQNDHLTAGLPVQ